ncbi:hypothetical protein LIER_00473 [Lithospermum erythrorhizon]|uniref:Uncharacterized protein n=1 Tax=Lithospermum erythrorhizon TaxID=34254 RepID=A0AAV3NHG2_LITER
MPPFSGGVLEGLEICPGEGEELGFPGGTFNMSSHPVDLSSGNFDSQNFARDTSANQRLVDESQTATSAGASIREGIEAASESPQATPAGSTPKKKKRSLVRGVKIPLTSEAAPSVPAPGAKSKEKKAENLLSAKDAWKNFCEDG